MSNKFYAEKDCHGNWHVISPTNSTIANYGNNEQGAKDHARRLNRTLGRGTGR